MRSIAKHAKALGRDLTHLQDLADRLSDMEAPDRRSHLAWLHEFISQNIIETRGEIDDSPEAMAAAHFATLDLCHRLARIEVSAKHAATTRIMPELLRRPRMQGDRGLAGLVWRAASIWRSLTGRVASVNKVTRAAGGDDRPDFAIFVANLAKMSCGGEPSLAEIETAFRTPKDQKKIPQ
jgi:hypothetical protein